MGKAQLAAKNSREIVFFLNFSFFILFFKNYFQTALTRSFSLDDFKFSSVLIAAFPVSRDAL